MDTPFTWLEDARLALLASDPARCTRAIQSFEEACRAEPPAAEDAARLRHMMAHLSSLADAAIEGVTAACDEMREAITAARHLTTYDAAGARAINATRAAVARRY